MSKEKTSVSKKADPVYLKGAYAKLFKTVIVQPCHETGTYKLSFIICEGNGKDPVSNGGKGSVTEEVVPETGLEPAHLAALDPKSSVSAIPPLGPETRATDHCSL